MRDFHVIGCYLLYTELEKLNTKSSKESEIFSASDYVPYNIWYVMFMHHLGFLNKSNKFFQDNQSAMRM